MGRENECETLAREVGLSWRPVARWRREALGFLAR
jgi:hypothetical protein